MLGLKTSLSLLLAFFSAAAHAQSGNDIGCFVPGECQGLYTAIAVRQDEYECNDYCTNDVATCQFWTFFADSDACFAFLDCPLDTANCAVQGDCISGDKGCVRFQCDKVGQCFGTTVGAPLITKNGDECLQACKDTVGCLWYTWDAGNNFCTLLEDCPVFDDTHLDFESGEVDCELTPAPTDPGVVNKLMVVGGLDPQGARITNVDVYDFSENQVFCPDPTPLPYGIDSGNLLFEETKASWLCGGRGQRDEQNPAEALDECLSYDSVTNQWNITATMTAARYAAAGVVLNTDSVVLTGGFGTNDFPLETSEVYQQNKFEPGPRMPTVVAGHCLLKLDENRLILIGGIEEQGQRSNKAYTFDLLAQTWTPIASMANARDYPSCQIVDSENQERGRELIVVGGGSESTLSTTEILRLDDDVMTWRDGPAFPVPIKEAASVSYLNTMKVLGGNSGDPQNTVVYDAVYEYDVGFQIWRNDSIVPVLARPATGLSAQMVDSYAVKCNDPVKRHGGVRLH